MGFTLEITGSVFNFTTFLTRYAKKLKCVIPLKKTTKPLVRGFL